MDPNLDVEALFAEFCRTREPACLGEIFDRCAEELFAVALHLGRDRVLAEDLVQSTFLIAIERACTWQPSRPLKPWLLGILHREAKVAQRRARRRVDVARVQRDEEQAPPQAALTAEARAAVATSLRAVPAPYREVLELHYVQGLPPARVAEALRRSPGAVRTQLWRGLALLRNALPAAFATSLGGWLEAQVPLAAARAQVLAAAGKPVLATSAVAIAGGVFMKKALMVVAALLLLPLAYQLLVPQPAPIAAGEPANTVHAPAVAATNVSPSPSPDVLADARRIEAGPGVRAAEPPAAAPDRVPAPAELNVLVVDLRGDPVADAQVAWYAPKLARTPDGREASIENREQGTLRQQRATDASGRTTLFTTRPCLVTAHKPGAGWSGDCVVRSGAAARELRLVLRPTGRVRGVVLAADGAAVPAATVRGYRSAATTEFATWLPPVATGADGRFELEAIADDEPYWLLASLGSTTNRPLSVTVAANQVVEVTLQFAGAFIVRGQLVDENGAPLVGRVLLHGDASDPLESHDWAVDSTASGRFEFELAEPGSYSLCAGVAGRTPAVATVVLDAAHPQAAVTLRVLPFVAVTGRVVDEQNTPLAGRAVMLAPEVDAATVARVATRSSLIGSIEPGTTDAEGVFRVMAPADWRYRALVQASAGNRELWSRSEPFTTPASGVLVLVRAADAQGYVLTGRVVAQSDGAKIAVAAIERLDDAGGGSRSAQPVGRTQDGSFRVGPFPTGRSYRFSFEAEGFARTIVGPFDAGVRTDDIVVRMPRLGSVRCRVLRADGTPAVAAFVSLEREVDDPFGRAWQGETDRTGCIELRDVEPQAFRVHARATRGAGAEATAPVTVQPGQPSDVLLTLPR